MVEASECLAEMNRTLARELSSPCTATSVLKALAVALETSDAWALNRSSAIATALALMKDVTKLGHLPPYVWSTTSARRLGSILTVCCWLTASDS